MTEDGWQKPLFFSDSKSHSSATCVGRVVGSSTYSNSTLMSPPPCRLGIILNATWNELPTFDPALRLPPPVICHLVYSIGVIGCAFKYSSRFKPLT